MYEDYYRTGLLRRFWKGDVALWKTYWLLGTIVGGVWGAVGGALIIEAAFRFPDHFPTIQVIFFLATGVLLIFTWVSIWRSAGNYHGRELWATLARGAVVLGALMVCGQAAKALLATDYQDAGKAELAQLNATLPRMVDSITRLDRIAERGKSIIYSYTITHNQSSLNFKLEPQQLQNAILPGACDSHMDLGYASSRFEYFDPAGSPITQVTATNEICSGF